MMKFTGFLLIISLPCFAQDDFNNKLSKRVDEIKMLQLFNIAISIFPDTTDLITGYPTWEIEREYRQRDFVSYKGKAYQAKAYSRGKNPTMHSNDWVLLQSNYHPYRFLRDTARLNDLNKLAKSKDPYVKTYAFFALLERGHENLYQLLLDNLKDKSKINALDIDVHLSVYPAELMLRFSINKFSEAQKSMVMSLIDNKYKYLNKGEYFRLHH